MIRKIKYLIIAGVILVPLLVMTSCEKFLTPEQELAITEDRLFKDWYEYRAVEMGMYALQQKLVEQIVVLGELRGDLLTITENADADLVEIHDFNVTKGNKYASPTGFFDLINASNNLIRILKKNRPDVMDPDSPVTNYDRLYGEALCMRAWAYFMAARIYGRVPYIYESLVTVEEIEDYVNSPGSYIDSVYIEFSADGYFNDTIYNHPVELEKKYFNLEMVLDVFTNQLEQEVKAVGVNHFVENNDVSWEVTVWNTYAYWALLGHLYLTQGDLVKAEANFRKILFNNTEELRYQLDKTFQFSMWDNIFPNINSNEHIYTLSFNKGDRQQHQLQSFFEPGSPHMYQMKPSQVAIDKWETVFRGQKINYNDVDPPRSVVVDPGVPGDYYRGPGVSYNYFNGAQYLEPEKVKGALLNRTQKNVRGYDHIMEGYYPVVWKFSIDKGIFDQDANFIVYRAGGVQLYMAEVYTYWAFTQGGGPPRTFTQFAVGILNDGSNYSTIPGRPQKGIRGRVALGSGDDKIRVSNIEYSHDPYTNQITGFRNLFDNLPEKQKSLENKIMDERARELAFEGERFFDLMRVAKRRNDPSYLAGAVAAKFPPGRRDQIFNHLLDENNWYIHYFD